MRLKEEVLELGISLLFSVLTASLVLAVGYGYIILLIVSVVTLFAVKKKLRMLAPQISVIVSGVAGLIPVYFFGDWTDLIILAIALLPVGYALAEPFIAIRYTEGGWED